MVQIWLWHLPQVPGVLRMYLGSILVLLWIGSAPLTSNALARQLEKPAFASDACCEVLLGDRTLSAPVVVLGADLNAYIESDNPYDVLSRDSLTRIQHAAALDTGNTHFYLMGGGQTSRKLSDFMARVLIDQGVENARIVRDRFSLSTVQNAQRLTELLTPDNDLPIILVTSSLHMNRAVSIFADRGFKSCPSAAGSLYSVSFGWVGLLPYIDGLKKTTLAWRELLATIKYRLLKIFSG